MKFLITLSLLISFTQSAFALETQKVTDNVYALVGEIGPRTAENFGSNNTVGFIVTDKGVVLVGSGAMPAGAKVIDDAIIKVTSQPVKWVINVGAQDHHWLGNSYFAKQGAQIMALTSTVTTQKVHINDHLNRLKSTSPNLINDIKPTYASKTFDEKVNAFELGGTQFELIWPGNGHFPGDGVLWMPKQKILFTGDFIFLDRILGIHPFSKVKEWQKSVHELAKLQAKHVIPGHGKAADWQKAKTQTVDYLDYLVTGVSKAQEEWFALDETVDNLAKSPQFESLANFTGWHRRNINRTFLQLESE